MKTSALIGLAGMLAGVIAWGGFNTVLEATNSMSFCLSCHQMRDTVYEEYQQSIHYQNPSGVRATCPDCHVPRDWSHKLLRKLQASTELYQWAVGTIDTPEKFEAERHSMAAREWERMRASDSQECRNCHSFAAMDFHKQSIKAARTMRDAAKQGKTCIDCHKAIAHKMPDVTANHRRLFQSVEAQAKTFRPAVGATIIAVKSLDLRPSPEAEVEGTLAAGHPVKVLAIQGDFVKVLVAGWLRQDTPLILYARQGKRITMAALTQSAQARLRTGTLVEDVDSGQNWSEANLEAWLPGGALTGDAQPLWAYAERVYQDNCTLCHARRSPQAYSANDWIGQINSMRRLTPLTDAESAVLLAYLQNHAKDTQP